MVTIPLKSSPNISLFVNDSLSKLIDSYVAEGSTMIYPNSELES